MFEKFVNKNIVWTIAAVVFIGFMALVGREIQFGGNDTMNLALFATMLSALVLLPRYFVTYAAIKVDNGNR